jgi:transketolase
VGELIGVGISESETIGLDSSEIVKLRKSFFDLLDLNNENDFIKFINGCRVNALYMICSAGSGHIGSSFSSAEFICLIEKKCVDNSDIFFSSKGHDSPMIYAVKIALGLIPESYLEKFRVLDGLPGHPEARKFGAEFSTGSLGMGISKAKGMARTKSIGSWDRRIFVLLGDGELQEGQIWESLVSISKDNFNITLVIDHNKIQSDQLVSSTSDLGNLRKKLESFGLLVMDLDGHSVGQIKKSIYELDNINGPSAIILNTIKGKGVSFCENNATEMIPDSYYRYHSGALNINEYLLARDELLHSIGLNIESEYLIFKSLDGKKVNSDKVKLIASYGEGLYRLCEKNRLLIYDADLTVDNSLSKIKKDFKEYFVQTGIAEQDMVSQAGASALNGVTSFVHSFAAFLTARANEQIYNNQLQGGNVIYVGSLAGMTPAQPGSSHQGVRDIASLGGMPNLVMFEPITERDAKEAAKIAFEMNSGVYIRVVSTPQDKLAIDNVLTMSSPGEGYEIRAGVGGKKLIITCGATFSRIALQIIDECREDIGLIVMPWINNISKEWVDRIVNGVSDILIITDHIVGVGPDMYLINAMKSYDLRVEVFGVTHPLFCGRNDEVFERVGLGKIALKNKISKFFDE